MSSVTWRRHPLRFVFGNWQAYRLALKMLDAERPCAVIGLGGFASVPTVLAAIRRRIPTIILEQNTIPGRATRFVSRWAGAVCVAFKDTASRLPASARVVHTGNPVRPGVASLHRRRDVLVSATPPTLLVLGGSQGAESLNEAVVGMLSQTSPPLKGWRIVHQTGPGQHDAILKIYDNCGLLHVVESFFDDLSEWYSQAAIVVGRAGATTLAELACAGLPAVLLPYPHAADNHQLANARAIAAAGAAVVVEHEQTSWQTSAKLAATLAALVDDAVRLAAMREASLRLARPDAARNVAAVLQSLIASSIT